MQDEILVFDPVANVRVTSLRAPKPLVTLRGLTVGVIDNTKPNFDVLAKELCRVLQRDYAVERVIYKVKHAPSVPATVVSYDELAKTCGLVFTGSGD